MSVRAASASERPTLDSNSTTITGVRPGVKGWTVRKTKDGHVMISALGVEWPFSDRALTPCMVCQQTVSRGVVKHVGTES